MKRINVLIFLLSLCTVSLLTESCGLLGLEVCPETNCNTGTLNEESCECDCPDGFTGANCEMEDMCITQNVVCENGGTCVDGTCDCPDGFEGERCDTKWSTKFLKAYSGTENCDPAGTDTYDLTLSQSANESLGINISNIYDAGLTSTGTLTSATTFTIPSQAFGASTLKGSGELNVNGTTVDMTFQVDFPDGTIYVCTLVLEPK